MRGEEPTQQTRRGLLEQSRNPERTSNSAPAGALGRSSHARCRLRLAAYSVGRLQWSRRALNGSGRISSWLETHSRDEIAAPSEISPASDHAGDDLGELVHLALAVAAHDLQALALRGQTRCPPP